MYLCRLMINTLERQPYRRLSLKIELTENEEGGLKYDMIVLCTSVL